MISQKSQLNFRKHFWGTLVQSVGVAFLLLAVMLPVLLWMALSGFGHMDHLHRHQEMQLYTAGLRLCHLSGNIDLIACVVDLKCSPVEPIFVSAAASRRHSFSKIDQMGFASLTVWNMKTWKAMATLPLGKDPPAITSLSFNHNGKILAASATDGMIHMFDMSAGLQITGWPAHDSAVSSVLFGPDETSIFSLGSDGKIFEWSLQSQGHVLWSRDCTRFCCPESEKICRHELAVDSNGRRLLVTSGSVRSPIYQVQEDRMIGFKTLAHTAPITSVDWHPTLPIFITGSADHSVRVTSLLQ